MRGGQFSLTIVHLAMDLVLEAGSSLRGAAARRASAGIASGLGLGDVVVRHAPLLDAATPSARIQEQYGWLRDYRAALANWTSGQAAAAAAVAHIRTRGVNRHQHQVGISLGLRSVSRQS